MKLDLAFTLKTAALFVVRMLASKVTEQQHFYVIACFSGTPASFNSIDKLECIKGNCAHTYLPLVRMMM